MNEIFYEIFSDLPRQGPGDVELTIKALNIIKQKTEVNQILDVGCGTGFQTIALALNFDGKITANDNYQPFLDELRNEAIKMEIEPRIECINAEMENLQLHKNSFDVIWSEGSLYIMGFENGLNSLKKFLKTKGYMVISEANWFKENPPNDLKEFWKNEYPAMMTIKQNLELIKNCGFDIIDHFPLSSNGWINNYYYPLEKNVYKAREKYKNNAQALDIVESVQFEIDMFKKYSDFYGYTFYIIQLRD